jgi:hypothetical protein
MSTEERKVQFLFNSFSSKENTVHFVTAETEITQGLNELKLVLVNKSECSYFLCLSSSTGKDNCYSIYLKLTVCL